ncbi:MAG TPA: hypothetical protein PLW55_11640, partial [Leptospiraceae bacterium]|nr:hypothetical protein [Leptospiraceae bacterium]
IAVGFAPAAIGFFLAPRLNECSTGHMAMFTFECQDCGQVFDSKMSLADRETGKSAVCEKCNSTRTLQVFKPLAVLGASGKSSAPERSCQPGGCACFPEAN